MWQLLYQFDKMKIANIFNINSLILTEFFVLKYSLWILKFRETLGNAYNESGVTIMICIF